MIMKGYSINERYRIIKMIGEGGMANVYLAEDTILERKVAVKILRGDLADDEKFVRRFQREAISASSLNHPNIVEMYDVGEDDGKYFIVMEYVEGRTLKSLIKRRGALTLHEIIDIMLQLTSALTHAHSSYIIHRDIKPQNVLILDDGGVKITDFGIAMALNSNELTQTNSVMGSVHYLPPEQANGNSSTIKSDIYSLGILMYELLTGKLPFKGDNAVEIAIKQMKEQIPSVCKLNPEIPQSIENIVLKACAKNPKNRYDSVNEMYDDLKNALNDDMINSRRIVYQYPEQELDETKKMPDISKISNVKKEEINIEPNNKKMNKMIIILSSIIIFILTVIGLFVIFYPKLTEVPEIKIPDVSNMNVVDAENKLKELGFKINTELNEDFSNDINEGLVINTNPGKDRSVKKGTTITLIISLGEKGIVLADYKGKNFYEIKAMLELLGINVLLEKKDVEDVTTVKEDIIIEQSPANGTKVVEGDTVSLFIPNIITKYPDFTDGSWSEADVEAFADKYNINLTIDYQESLNHSSGTIIYQSRKAESEVINGAILRIIVTTEINTDDTDPIDDIIGR